MEKKEFIALLDDLTKQQEAIQEKIDNLINRYAASLTGFKAGQKVVLKNYNVYPNKERIAYLHGWKYVRTADRLDPVLTQGGSVAPWQEVVLAWEVMEHPKNQ